MYTISDYELINEIYSDDMICVYAGKNLITSIPVILKFCKNIYPDNKELERIQKEYNILKSLNNDGIIKPIDIKSFKNNLALILEDSGSITLKSFLQNNPFNLINFLEIAIQLADTLGYLHTKNIIHKDINPKNVLINLSNFKVKIIDFSISSELHREDSELRNPEKLEGTLAYISPEQTGRMNRYIDYRTDIYSLGITLYELITKKLPFEYDDILEITHAHLARTPQSPSELNFDIPDVISKIILKCLNKAPEDRYQNAFGLKADLQNCLDQLIHKNKISNFHLGEKDISAKFQIPQKLYARENELKILMDNFEQTCLHNKTHFVLLNGYSGTGKTALVNEIKPYVLKKHSLFLYGKYDKYKNNIPLMGIIQAFESLIQQLLTEPQKKLNKWKEKLNKALAPNAQILIDLIPDLELIIGKQPSAPVLGPNETQNRLELMIFRFVKILAVPEHPLIIFLDDLQYVDIPSFNLIKLFFTNPQELPLLLIAAYRDNEATENQFIDKLNELKQFSVNPIIDINIPSFNLEIVNEIVAETLNYSTELTHSLATLLFAKTQGNPFFVIQLFTLWQQKQLIYFDFENNQWNWELAKINQTKISTSVLDLMINKCKNLPQKNQDILKMAACIGITFKLGILATITQLTEKEIRTILWQCVYDGLIVFSGNDYRFMHEKAREACYELIPKPERKFIHLKIGQLLLEKTDKFKLNESIFDIINHLNIGMSLIDAPIVKIDFAKLNILAGDKAKSTAAYHQALKYYDLAYQVFVDNLQEKDYGCYFNLCCNRVECLYLINEFSKAEELIAQTFAIAKTIDNKLKLYNIQIVAYNLLGKYNQAIEIGIAALKLAHVFLPRSPSIFTVIYTLLKVDIKLFLCFKNPDKMLNFPLSNDPEFNLVVSIMNNLGASIYMLGEEKLFAVLILKGMFMLLNRKEQAKNSAFAYTGYAVIIGAVLHKHKKAEKFAELGIQLTEKYNMNDLKTKACHLSASMIYHWSHPYQYCIDKLKQSRDSGLNYGDFTYACYSFNDLFWFSFFAGENLDQVYAQVKIALETLQQAKLYSQLTDLLLAEQLCLSLQNLNASPFFDSQKINQEVYLSSNVIYIHIILYFAKMLLYYFKQDYGNALINAQNIFPLVNKISGEILIENYIFYYSLILTELYPKASNEQQQEYRKILRKNIKLLKNWAKNCSANTGHKYLLIMAEIYRIYNRKDKAAIFYDRAIDMAIKNAFNQDVAIANECAAKFYLACDKSKLAIPYLVESIYFYNKWGGVLKVKLLEETYPTLLYLVYNLSGSLNTPLLTQHAKTTSSSTEKFSQNMDINSVIKFSQAISEEIKIEKLLAKLISVILENTGAEKGALILKNEQNTQFYIEAEGDSEKLTVLKSISLEDSPSICLGIIQYVSRTKKTLVLENAQDHSEFKNDPYIILHKVKSVLCAPIINQSKFIGLIYLENNLAPQTFNKSRQALLKVLASQAAIAIANARLYQEVFDLNKNLEQKVLLQTKNLQLANSQLQDFNLELNKINQDMTKAKEDAEKANRFKSIFLAQMTHDLRTPLHVIIGSLDMLRKQNNIAPDQLEKSLDISLKSAEKQLSLVNDILDISKIESGKTEMSYKNFNIEELFIGLNEIMRTLFKDKQVNFVLENLVVPPLIISSDKLRLNQVVINLLSNAAKFTKKGEIRLKVYIKTKKIFFEISDTGIGLAKEDLNRIFESYAMVDNDLQQVQQGTGLGLSICKGFVEALNGKIWAESELGAGSRFTFWIPLIKGSSIVEISEQSTDLSMLEIIEKIKDKKILLCDDDEFNRSFAQMIMEGRVKFALAESGKKAIELLKKENYDLIFMDMQMPEMNGKMALKEIRKFNTSTPVIALTAQAIIGTKDELLNYGFDGYLSKPFKEDDFFGFLAQQFFEKDSTVK